MVTSIAHKSIMIMVMLLGSISISYSQSESVSLGNIFIPAEGSVALFSEHNFQELGNGLLPGILATDRSSKNGKLVFSNNSSWSNAGTYSHVDGFVSSTKRTPFLFPTGDNGVYAPIGANYSFDINAAYYAVDPSYATTSIILSDEYTEIPEDGPFNIYSFISNVETVTDKEYWVVRGRHETKITLTWDEHSGIEELVKSNLEHLTIVGWDGTEWVDIPSSIDLMKVDTRNSNMMESDERSDFNSGSITTDSQIIPDAYSVISLGKMRFDKSLDHNSLIVYPNPVSTGSFLNVRYQLAKSDIGELKLFDSNNKLIYREKLGGKDDKIEIPLNQYGRGVFNIAITSENGTTVYKKLIVVGL